ncbi:MAG: IS110 family transposase [Gammaproteobacteria bacterium]|nr:IS110 family transposase [Gammaproteobacteria bacterium]MCB1871157.1 IS110 family transposase [Gammaproteobacteria bacterium]
MKQVERIGIDIAKNVFLVHGVDEHEKVVLRKELTRAKVLAYFAQLPSCLIGMEACGGAHYWGRELTKLGHDIRLIAPQFVIPYRKNDKNDGNDAEAICEALGRPSMRFIAIKDEQQQAVMCVHRARSLLIEERTALVNQSRGLLTEYGLVVPLGVGRLRQALPDILEDGENGLPMLAREVFADLYERLRMLDQRITKYDRRIAQLAREMEPAKRLMQLDGVGPLTATAIVATAGDAQLFKNGRQFAAWLGMVPRQKSTGGKPRLGRITKRGDVYLRTLLVHGARSVLVRLSQKEDAKSRWAAALVERRGFNKAVVALAAKHA